jgi:hypothetical protein
MFKFEVLPNGPTNESVWLWAEDGRDVILGAVSREAIQDDAEPPQTNLSYEQRVLLASANVEEIATVLRRKIAAGEAFRPNPGDRPRVEIRSGELRQAGVTLKTTVLGMPFKWV